MGKFRHIIGIDVSKDRLDWVWITADGALIHQDQVDNHLPSLTAWIHQLQTDGLPLQEALFCLEPTGPYSNLVVDALQGTEASVWVASPLDITLSTGLTRGKSDPVDAERIAHYGLRFQDKARLAAPNRSHLQKLQQLLSQRERLVVDRAKYKSQIRELPPFWEAEAGQLLEQNLSVLILTLDQAIERLERAIRDLIREATVLAAQYELLTSIDGVGPVLAWTVLAATHGFTKFDGPRQFACHTGVAPFHYSSGTIRGPGRVSHRANKRLKSLLHMGALSAIGRPGELQTYYQRKTDEGKPKMSVLNAVRNKIIHRMYAVIKHGRPYQSEPLAT